MSPLVLDAIARAGLGEIANARKTGDLTKVADLAARLQKADLLAIGALADLVRAEEAGDDVRIYANAAAADDDARVVKPVVPERGTSSGMEFLRAVAVARITGPRGARVRVDWMAVGLELAQVALGFGASELCGAIANKRGLAIADSAEKKVKGQGMVSAQLLKAREIARLVGKAGRRAIVIGPHGVVVDDTARESQSEIATEIA